MVNVLVCCRSGIAVAALILFVITTLTGCIRSAVSVETVDKMIKDRVPIGSDKTQVRAFIDNLTVGSLEIGRDAEFHEASKRALGNRDPEKIAELGDRIAEFIGVVIFKAQSDGLLTYNDIVVQFYIDKNGHMIGYTVKMVGAV